MQPAAIENVERAFREIKRFCPMEAWEGDYRPAARQALKTVLQEQMTLAVDRQLEELERQGIPDRRNGVYPRHLLTELGDLELSIPRTRTFSPAALLKQWAGRFARRAHSVERMILLSFTLGLSTRKVSRALLPILGEPISPATVSRVAHKLDEAVEAFHRRPLADRYEVLLLDGVVLKRRTGAGARKRVILVALGILPDGRREIIDFRQASDESQSAWEGLLNSLYRRGLKGKRLRLIVTDGGKGMINALPLVYGEVVHQRCWAHKTRNVLDKVKKTDRDAVKKSLQRISHAANQRQAENAAKQFAQKWAEDYPVAVACLTKDLPELLAFYQVRLRLKPSEVRTTNAIERRFVEVRRRTRPMGTFSDRTSIERILFSIFMGENQKQKTWTPFLLTQDS
jgi:putative transposase